MKKNAWMILGAMVLSGFLSCNSSSKVAATINGKPVYIKEVDEAAKNQLKKVDFQIYEIRKQFLDEVIENRLIKEAAQAKGLKPEEYLKQEVTDKITPPSDEELKAMYETHKQKDTEPFDQVKEELTSYVMRNREQMQRRQLLAQLRDKAKVEIKLDAPRLPVTEGGAPAKGPANAPVTMIEFSDFQCPFCGRARPTVNQILSAYGDKIRYVFRDFPLSFHPDAFLAHVAAHCAGDQGKFWEYNQTLFDNQRALKTEDLKEYAEDLELNAETFNQCLTANKYSERVQASIRDGVDFGVSGTPAFFINGIMLSGAQPFPRFKEIIDTELQKK